MGASDETDRGVREDLTRKIVFAAVKEARALDEIPRDQLTANQRELIIATMAMALFERDCHRRGGRQIINTIFENEEPETKPR